MLRRPALLPGESLPSWLYRLAQANYYEPPEIFWGLVARPGEATSHVQACVSSTTSVPLLERIAGLTKRRPGEVLSATIHRFAPVFTPPQRPLCYLQLAPGVRALILQSGFGLQQLRSPATAQFCPLCLAQRPHHRLVWIPWASAVCLEHACLLADRCPGCKQPVSIDSVAGGICRSCGARLRMAPAISVAEDRLGLLAQRVMQIWFMNGVSPPEPGPRLPDQTARVLYDIVVRLTPEVRYAGPSWWYRHRGPHHAPEGGADGASGRGPMERLCTYTTAFKALLNWPEGFCRFLSAYRWPGKDPLEWYPQIGLIYLRQIDCRWQQAEFGFLQEAFDDYLREYYGDALAAILARRYARSQSEGDAAVLYSLAEVTQLLPESQRLLRRVLQVSDLAWSESAYEPFDWRPLFEQAGAL